MYSRSNQALIPPAFSGLGPDESKRLIRPSRTPPKWAASPSFLPLALQPHLCAVAQSRHALFEPVAGHAGLPAYRRRRTLPATERFHSTIRSPRGAAKPSKTRCTLWLRETSLPASEAHSFARRRTYCTLTRCGSKRVS